MAMSLLFTVTIFLFIYKQQKIIITKLQNSNF